MDRQWSQPNHQPRPLDTATPKGRILGLGLGRLEGTRAKVLLQEEADYTVKRHFVGWQGIIIGGRFRFFAQIALGYNTNKKG